MPDGADGVCAPAGFMRGRRKRNPVAMFFACKVCQHSLLTHQPISAQTLARA